MGRWGSGNFESDGALDYMGEVSDELAARIEDILAAADRSALDEEGEDILMPSVAVLSALHEHCHAPTPKPGAVRRWRRAYLAIFDDQINGLAPGDDGFKQERREVIDGTFGKLESQSVAFWKGKGELEDHES